MKFESLRIGDVATFQNGFAFKSKDFIKNGKYKIIKIKELKDGLVKFFDDSSCVSIEIDDNNKKYIVNNGDVLFALTGDPVNKNNPLSWVGRVSLYNYNEQALLNQRVCKLIPSDNLNPLYLYYFFRVFENFYSLASKATGSASQANISTKTISDEKILLPCKNYQNKIVSILSDIDDKIELNQKINTNLEQQSQAIFKSWFVDFEPFGGVMPADWKKTDIYSIANIIYGAPFKSKLFNTNKEGKPIIRIRDLKSQSFVTYTTENNPKGYLLKHGDIVVGMDGEFKPYIWGNDEAWLNQRICVFENKRLKGKMFLLYTISPLLNLIEQIQVATTVIHIGKKDFDSFKIIMPDEKTLEKFDEITNPIFWKIVSNKQENQRLSALRDTLLPKLMNGEIDVSEVKI